MKLRLQESGIILRLQPEEIEVLAKEKKLVQQITLPGAGLRILLEVREVDQIDIRYAANDFHFILPAQCLDDWHSTNQVGFHRQMDTVAVTIERDLPRRTKH